MNTMHVCRVDAKVHSSSFEIFSCHITLQTSYTLQTVIYKNLQVTAVLLGKKLTAYLVFCKHKKEQTLCLYFCSLVVIYSWSGFGSSIQDITDQNCLGFPYSNLHIFSTPHP